MERETQMLSASVDSFVDFIRSLPPEDLELSKTEKWGAREVLIHLVFWHEQYAQIAADVFAGRKRDLQKGTFKEINASAVEQNASVPVEELIARWASAQRKLQRIGSKPHAGRLKVGLRAGSKEWPFLVLLRLAAGHILKHEEKLRKSLGIKKHRKAITA